MKKVYFLIFNGFSDWEAAYVLPEIAKSKKYQIITVGFDREPVRSMGELTVLPDLAVDEIEPQETALLILPGGNLWEETSSEKVIALVRDLHAAGTPVAAICGATLEIARAGLFRETRHTSNGKAYLEQYLENYADGDFYSDELAVTDQNLITASGIGAHEFTHEILVKLDIYSRAEAEEWFQFFKNAVIPERFKS
jgi:putative intracellular protease/amidase